MATKRLYFETLEGVKDLEINLNSTVSPPEDEDDGIEEMGILSDQVKDKLDKAQEMIRDCAEYTLNSFKNFAAAEVDEITLKFGITVGGEGGIIISKGTLESNIEIEIKCKFPN